MGFWHTSYIEHHEADFYGLGDYQYKSSPLVYRCALCSLSFTSEDSVRKHRFESHPLHRPMLFIQGKEIGGNTYKITSMLAAGDVVTEGSSTTTINGLNVEANGLTEYLMKAPNGTYQIELCNNEIRQNFTLEIRISLTQDLTGVETELAKLARKANLTSQSVADFIEACTGYPSALSYCDGICSYLYGVMAKENLYGVMAKENAPVTSLPHSAYVEKFNKAAESLSSYNRPLAAIICGLINFHFNHFADASSFGGNSRVHAAASKFQAWLSCAHNGPDSSSDKASAVPALETLLTDWDTEHLLRWSILTLAERKRQIPAMEEFLNRNLLDYDSLKLHVLLAQTYLSLGSWDKAIVHTRPLRNLKPTEKWAESILQCPQSDKS